MASLMVLLYDSMTFLALYIYQINPALRRIPTPQIIMGNKTSNPVNSLPPVKHDTKGKNKKEFAAITKFAWSLSVLAFCNANC